jgi:glutathione S-transferase
MAVIGRPMSPLVGKLRGVHLFGFDGAPCSQRVSFALAEKGLVRGSTVPWASDAAPLDADAARLCEALVELGKKLHVSVRYVSFRWGLKGLGKIDAESEATVRRLERSGSPEQLVAFYSRYNRDDIDAGTYLEHLRALEAGWGEQDARLVSDGRPFLLGDAFSKADIIWSIKVLRILECGYPFEQNFPSLSPGSNPSASGRDSRTA